MVISDKIIYGTHHTSLGRIILAKSAQGLCWLGFMVSKEKGAYKGDGLSRMKAFYPHASFVADDACTCTDTQQDCTTTCTHTSTVPTATASLLGQVLSAWERDALRSVPLDLRGTPFQLQVWNALLDIRRGDTVSYGDIASIIDRPKACRAVGSAVGENPVSLLVPCHRVLQKSGKLGNYGWGLPLKETLLRQEGVLK